MENTSHFFKYKSDDSCIGSRLDKYISALNNDISRSRIQKLIKNGKVKIDGKIISKNYVLKGFEDIEIDNNENIDDPFEFKPYDVKLGIIYEDDFFLALTKPAGMVVHPGAGHSEDTLINALINYDEKFKGLGQDYRAGIVHRLDKETSGIMIVAKTEKIHSVLSDMFKNRLIFKKYTALASGSFMESSGQIDMPLGRSRSDRKKIDIIKDGRKSLTEFKILKRFKGCDLLEVSPKTGRTHQIRVHLKAIGHPVIGDKVYGNAGTDKIASLIGINRQFLHASSMSFSHPVSKEPMNLSCKLTDDLAEAIEKLENL